VNRAPRLDRLRHVRHERSEFDSRFYQRHDEFWPIARAASTFADRGSWPEVDEYTRAFEGEGPVRFAIVPARKRRARGTERTKTAIARDELYDAVIVRRATVPTRPAMWHDYLNALVWATFPRAKRALHRRQHAAIERWLPTGATELPNARTRELDALALIDEGGVLVLGSLSILFGHALFEGLVFGQPAMIARAVPLSSEPPPADRAAALRLADGLLAAMIADDSRLLSPDELPRLPLF
jgi:hypothetical protein